MVDLRGWLDTDNVPQDQRLGTAEESHHHLFAMHTAPFALNGPTPNLHDQGPTPNLQVVWNNLQDQGRTLR